MRRNARRCESRHGLIVHCSRESRHGLIVHCCHLHRSCHHHDFICSIVIIDGIIGIQSPPLHPLPFFLIIIVSDTTEQMLQRLPQEDDVRSAEAKLGDEERHVDGVQPPLAQRDPRDVLQRESPLQVPAGFLHLLLDQDVFDFVLVGVLLLKDVLHDLFLAAHGELAAVRRGGSYD